MTYTWIVVFAAVSTVGTKEQVKLNVGTTLFRPSDVSRRCWSFQEVAQANARRMAQHLIPEDMKFDDDEQALAAVKYVHTVVEVVERKTSSKPTARLLVLRAVADAIGGWLQVRALPRARASFYAGHLSYDATRQLHSLLEEARSVLHTDGQHWRHPELVDPGIGGGEHRSRRSSSASPMTPSCKQLLTRGRGENLRIPLPFLDGPTHPVALAVPVRGRVLTALDDPSSESLLVHFYEAASHCLARSKYFNRYQYEMNKWLRSDVYPLLMDGRWYPALGGTAMLIKTTATTVATTQSRHNGESCKVQPNLQNWVVEGGQPVPAPPPAQLPIAGDAGNRISHFFHSLTATETVALLLASALLVWLKVAFCFVLRNCYRRRRKGGNDSSAGISSGGSGSEESTTPSTTYSGDRATVLNALPTGENTGETGESNSPPSSMSALDLPAGTGARNINESSSSSVMASSELSPTEGSQVPSDKRQQVRYSESESGDSDQD